MSGTDEEKTEKIKKYIDNIYTWKNCLCMKIISVIFILVLILTLFPTLINFFIQKVLNVQTIPENINMIWNNTPYFCLFLIACLGLIGAIVFFLFTCCREKTKQALLTYAYDEALKKIEDDRDKHLGEMPKKDIDSKTQKETNESVQGQGQAQNPKPIEETITMNRYYKKAVTKIFETYCQNITSK